MTTGDMYDYLRDKDYDVDKIPNDLFDKMEDELDTIESDCLAEESDRNCGEVKMMFIKQLKEFKKNKKE